MISPPKKGDASARIGGSEQNCPTVSTHIHENKDSNPSSHCGQYPLQPVSTHIHENKDSNKASYREDPWAFAVSTHIHENKDSNADAEDLGDGSGVSQRTSMKTRIQTAHLLGTTGACESVSTHIHENKDSNPDDPRVLSGILSVSTHIHENKDSNILLIPLPRNYPNRVSTHIHENKDSNGSPWRSQRTSMKTRIQTNH